MYFICCTLLYCSPDYFRTRTLVRALLPVKGIKLSRPGTPQAAFTGMTDFIGPPCKKNIHEHFAQAVNQVFRDQFAEWQEWTLSQGCPVQAIRGKQMQKDGYCGAVAWLKKLDGRQ